MELLAIPLLALGGLYYINNQKKTENYEGILPNTDIPDVNFFEGGQEEITNSETDITAKLGTVSKYDTPEVYTDKYFNPEMIAKLNASSNMLKADSSFKSLTGDTVKGSYFQHNNMVPFFGSTLRTRIVNENSNEGLIDSLTGAGSQYMTKKEQSPLFSPQENLQWAHGMPSSADFMQSRMNVSNKMSNVKPFEEIRVRPGLGKSDNGIDSLGYNSGMMARESWMPKNVDQMRATNNPKPGGYSAFGYEGPAGSLVQNRGYQAEVKKNRPERVSEMDESRYFATLGASGGAPTMHGVPVDRPDENRATATTSYIGAATAASKDAYVDGEYMPTHRIQLGSVPLAPVDGVGHYNANESDYGVKSFKTYANNRNTSNIDDYFGAVGGALGAVVAPLLDVLRPSKRQNAIGTMRPYQNPESTVKNSYLFNPADRPTTTIREMTESGNGHLFVNGTQDSNAYTISKPMDLYTNRRDTTTSYGGAIGTTLAKESRNYDAEYRQRNNENKSSTIDGRMVPGNMSLMQGDINMRNKTLDNDLVARRAANASMPYATPDASKMGRVTGAQQLYSNVELDRNESYVLSSLKTNPYAMRPLNGGY
jgi:hypothetical protein